MVSAAPQSHLCRAPQPQAAAGDKETGLGLTSGIFPPSLLPFHFPALKRRHQDALAPGCYLLSASMILSSQATLSRRDTAVLWILESTCLTVVLALLDFIADLKIFS